jgi:hypothetical protein
LIGKISGSPAMTTEAKRFIGDRLLCLGVPFMAYIFVVQPGPVQIDHLVPQSGSHSVEVVESEAKGPCASAAAGI